MRRRYQVSVLHVTTVYAHGVVTDDETGAVYTWICSGIGFILRDSKGGIISPVPGGLRLAVNRTRRAAARDHAAQLTEKRGG